MNLTRPGVKMIRLREGALRFRVRGAMDVWSIKETFLDRFYEEYGYTIQPDWTIIDIGAGIGEYAIYAAAAQPSSRVFAFEPYPESFMLMQENLRLNRIKNVQTFNEAVAAASGELMLDLTGGEPLQFQSHPEKTGPATGSLPVYGVSLVDVLAKLDLESCDLIKLDCEGAEYPILFSTPPPVLQLVRRIVMEYHDDPGPYNHGDLVRFLNEQGFHVETFSNPVHSYLGYLRAIRK